MNTIFVPKDKLEERKKQKEQCLHLLYYVEDLDDFVSFYKMHHKRASGEIYDYEIISKCIDELQKLEIKEDKEMINNDL